MNDLDREFTKQIEAKIAQIRMIATLKKDKAALAELEYWEVRHKAALAKMECGSAILQFPSR